MSVTLVNLDTRSSYVDAKSFTDEIDGTYSSINDLNVKIDRYIKINNKNIRKQQWKRCTRRRK